MPGSPVGGVLDLEPQFWGEGMAMFVHNALSPWLGLVDQQRYSALCDRVQGLGMSTIATAHSPLITEAAIGDAFRLLRALPSVPCPPCPDQAVLDAILSGTPA